MKRILKNSVLLWIVTGFLACSEEKKESSDKIVVEDEKRDSASIDKPDTQGQEEKKTSLIPAMKDYNKWGYQDSTGKWVIEPEYYFAKEFSGGFAFVSDGDFNWKLINEIGEVVLGFDTIEPIVIHNELSGENTVYGFSEGLLPVMNKEGKIGFMNKDFKMLIPFRYDDVTGFSDGVCGVLINNQDKSGRDWWLINKSGKILTKEGVHEIYRSSDNRVLFKLKGFYSFMQTDGEIDYDKSDIYNEALRFKEGMTFVTNSENYTDYFLIDTMGNIINKGPYEAVYNLGFENGECEVRKNGKCIIIDKKGNKIRDKKEGCQEGC